MNWQMKIMKQKGEILYMECFDAEEDTLSYYVLKIDQKNLVALQAAIATGKSFDVKEYGKVLASDWGPLPLRYEDIKLSAEA